MSYGWRCRATASGGRSAVARRCVVCSSCGRRPAGGASAAASPGPVADLIGPLGHRVGDAPCGEARCGSPSSCGPCQPRRVRAGPGTTPVRSGAAGSPPSRGQPGAVLIAERGDSRCRHPVRVLGREGEAAAHETWTGQACTLRSLLCPTFAITRVILHAEETVRSAARPEEGGESMSAVKAAAVRSARRTILTSLAPA